MTIYTHPTLFQVHHSIDTTQIHYTSQIVTKKTGMMIQANKSIVGSNAFAHESGIHQDGYLKNKSTYEIISPAVVGIPAKALVLGKHSGRNALYSRIDEIVKNTMYADHLQASPDLYKNLFVAFKALADNCKTGVTDEDLFALLDEQLNITAGQPWVFESLELQSSANASTATVVILDSTLEKRSETAFGQGPVSAIFNAIQGIVGNHHTVASFDVQAISSGSESLGKSTVKLTTGAESGLTYQGQGTDSNVLIASAKAYVNAVNKVESARTLLRSSSGTRKVDI